MPSLPRLLTVMAGGWSGRSNQARSGNRNRSKWVWPVEADIPLSPTKKEREKEREKKRREKELATRRKEWAFAIIGAVFTVPIVLVIVTMLYGLLTVGQRLSIPFPEGTQSPQARAVSTPEQQSRPPQPETPSETQAVFEVFLQAGEVKKAVESGPGITWNIQSNKPFIIYGIAEDNSKGPEYRMLPGNSAWGGDVRRSLLLVRGVEDDTLIKFFRQ